MANFCQFWLLSLSSISTHHYNMWSFGKTSLEVFSRIVVYSETWEWQPLFLNGPFVPVLYNLAKWQQLRRRNNKVALIALGKWWQQSNKAWGTDLIIYKCWSGSNLPPIKTVHQEYYGDNGYLFCLNKVVSRLRSSSSYMAWAGGSGGRVYPPKLFYDRSNPFQPEYPFSTEFSDHVNNFYPMKLLLIFRRFSYLAHLNTTSKATSSMRSMILIIMATRDNN